MQELNSTFGLSNNTKIANKTTTKVKSRLKPVQVMMEATNSESTVRELEIKAPVFVIDPTG